MAGGMVRGQYRAGAVSLPAIVSLSCLELRGRNTLLITLLERLPRIGSLGGSLAFALACSCLAFLARLALDAGAPASLSVLIVYPVIVLAGAVGGAVPHWACLHLSR